MDPIRPTAAQIAFFESKVRPLLVAHCQQCHGGEKQKGGLRLDSRDAMLKGGDSGPALHLEKLGESLLLKAIGYQDEPKMPPKGKLSDSQIAILTEWIRQGAPWPSTDAKAKPTSGEHAFHITDKDRTFWSFQPIADPPLPHVQNVHWVKSPVDYFILAKHEAAGIQSVGATDKRTLLRRVTFDLIGLPPTPEEINSFLKDTTPEAYARVVDRLLSSPRYGERWARHWLDVARYGEDQAHTFQARLYPNGYRYRDWLIRAFNNDMPYDRFIKEQIAADLLPVNRPPEELAALGFFALGPVYYGDAKGMDQIDDRIDTLTRGFLGLTVACARCHDHKFDPISTQDYYALAGVFASTQYKEVPLIPQSAVEEAQNKLTDQEKKNKKPAKYPLVHALADASKPVTLKVHLRGNPDTLGDDVSRRFLAILDTQTKPFKHGSGRLELAEAIASKDNPLTARVIVNRIWQHHFGRGLVRTASNFGHLGEVPTHPELLDYLATRLVRSGWSLKALHREILLSATYQQSCGSESRNKEIDADNKLLWHMNRQRLEVEAWRDAMLAVAGTLDNTVGGPSGDLAAADNRRRTLYGSVSRHELNPLLRLFDFPDPNITNDVRTVTTVPLQNLFVMNSEFLIRNAKALTQRLASAGDDAARVRIAYLSLYARPVSDQELHMALEFLHASSSKTEDKLTRWEQLAQALLSANEFLYVD